MIAVDSMLDSVMAELKQKGSEKNRKTYNRHGIPIDRTFGVSMADLKLVAKTIKKQQTLAYQLYETGYMDPMYLAGIVADGSQMSEDRLNAWADGAAGMPMISEYTVPWVAVESAQARQLALRWIASPQEHVASSGWCTCSGIVATFADKDLDMAEISALLEAIPGRIHDAPNRVRGNMNSFVISVGIYVQPLMAQAKATARKIGAVYVDVGDTACEIPVAGDSIAKAEAAGRAGKKRKTIRC